MKAVRVLIGLAASVAAAIIFVTSLYTLIRTSPCGYTVGTVCPPETGAAALRLGGSVLLGILGAVLTLGAGLLLSFLVAGVMVLRDGSGTAGLVVGVGLIAVPVLLAAAVSAAVRKSGRTGGRGLAAEDTAGGEPARAADPSAGLAVELERIAALHRVGDLTDEEFTNAKRRLLGGATPMS